MSFSQSTSSDLTFSDVAEVLTRTHRLVYLSEADELYEFDGARYKGGVEAELARITEGLNPHAKNQFCNEVIGKVKRRVRHVKVGDFDAKPYLCNVKNGVVDLRTGTLLEHTPAELFLNQLEVEYDPRLKDHTFEKFLASVLPEHIDRLRVIDHFASCLYRVPIKKALMLVGETDSGKSTTLNLLREFLGSENVSSVSLQEMQSDRFALADLFGKLANVAADISDAELKDTGRFKISTGKDQVRVQRKNGQPFHIVPFAKQFYSANKIPQTKDESDAFFNRFDVVEFPYRFVDDPAPYAKNLNAASYKRKDPDILEKLLTPVAKTGLLNILVARARTVIALKAIPSGASVTETRDLWLYHSDFMENFLKDRTQLDPEAREPKATIYAAYCLYCRERKITPQSKTALNTKIEQRGCQPVNGKPDGKHTVKLWKGIKLRSEWEKAVESVEEKRSTISTTNSLLRIISKPLDDGPLADAGEALSAWQFDSQIKGSQR
jgi:putative DNA primase/helicase